ncbi:MAG: SoxR reducing system RseC family protein [Bacillota bacterium]
MREVGLVVAATSGRARVRMTRSDMCSKCGRCGELVHGNAETMIIEVADPLGTTAGDLVEVEVGSQDILRAAALLYLLPLALAVLGYLAGRYVAGGPGNAAELGGLFGGMLSFAVSFWLLRHIDRRASESGRYLPVIVRTVGQE